jgi:dephospho-CoA kinase
MILSKIRSNMDSECVVATVGLCGTGKSVASKYIEEVKGFKSVYFGGYVLAEIKRRNLEINSANERVVRESLRREFGIDVIARRAAHDIDSQLEAGLNVVIDGLYSFSEFLYLKEKYDRRLFILALHAAKEIRYRRLGSRKVRPLTPQQVDERDFFEIKNIEKAGPIAIADYHIINDGTVEELHRNIDTILNKLRGTK